MATIKSIYKREGKLQVTISFPTTMDSPENRTVVNNRLYLTVLLKEIYRLSTPGLKKRSHHLNDQMSLAVLIVCRIFSVSSENKY